MRFSEALVFITTTTGSRSYRKSRVSAASLVSSISRIPGFKYAKVYHYKRGAQKRTGHATGAAGFFGVNQKTGIPYEKWY